LQDHHFDTIEVIEAKLQFMLNTLTEHDLQDAFKNGRNAGNGAYMRKGTSRVMVASSSKVSFHQMAAPVMEIMGGSLCLKCKSLS
jgi:hypothetical protein